MASPSELIAQLRLQIDHYEGRTIVPGSAAKTDQRPAADLITALKKADAANTTALAAIATAQASDPEPAHTAWAASVASTAKAMQRAQRAANQAPSSFATDGVRVATMWYQNLVKAEPPATVLAAVAAATTAQQITQSELDLQVKSAQLYLDYLSVF